MEAIQLTVLAMLLLLQMYWLITDARKTAANIKERKAIWALVEAADRRNEDHRRSMRDAVRESLGDLDYLEPGEEVK